MTIVLWQKMTFSGILALSCATHAWASPDIFSKLSLAQAKQQAQKDSKYLLVDCMASWCQPCKKMEKTTWVDDNVKAWIKENAIAIQIDVDKDEKSSSELRIEAMPTLVLFTPQSAAKEFGRQDGYMDAAELMQWLNGVKSGKTKEQMEKELSTSNGTEAWEHVSKARVLQTAGKNAEALEEYFWLWNKISEDDANLGEIRNSMVSHEMKSLCAVLPAARQKIAELRDAAEKSNIRYDWILLNGVLDDNARTLAWFDKIKSDPAQKEVISANITLLEAVLGSASRWADAARYLYTDPIGKINEYYKRAEKMKHPGPDTEVAKDFDPFPSMVLMLYGSYIGANRDAEAQKIADECIRLDDKPTMRQALGNMADAMKQARSAQNKTESSPAKK